MALISCTECMKEISDKAAACPNCGNPIKQITAESKIVPGDRKCMKCGYTGQMKTWLSNYNAPQFIALILLFFYIIPGLIFIALSWGKHKCPKCGSIGSNSSAYTY